MKVAFHILGDSWWLRFVILISNRHAIIPQKLKQANNWEPSMPHSDYTSKSSHSINPRLNTNPRPVLNLTKSSEKFDLFQSQKIPLHQITEKIQTPYAAQELTFANPTCIGNTRSCTHISNRSQEAKVNTETNTLPEA